MKRLIVAIALLAGCAQTAPSQVPVQTHASHWFGNPAATVNIHETAQGLAGRMQLSTGEIHPVRQIVLTDTSLSFIVPTLDARFTGSKDGQGWAGDWTAPEGTTRQSLAPAEPVAPKIGQFVNLRDGREIYIDCRGTGLPAVLFDSGSGGNHAHWPVVQDEVAKTNMACTFDRAGLALSDPGPLPRDAAATADDIDAMLSAANIPPPYALVGHSLGSFHIRQYANTRLPKVAGIVLVDPSGDNQYELLAAAIPTIKATPGMGRELEQARFTRCLARLRVGFVPKNDASIADCFWNDADSVEALYSEVDAMNGSSLQQLTASRRSYGALPLIVLTRGDYERDMPIGFNTQDRAAMKEVWLGLHREMTGLSTIGQNRIIAGAGHFIQAQHPEAVITAVRDVLALAATGR